MGRGVGVNVVGMGAVAVVRMDIVTMVRLSVVGVGVMRVGGVGMGVMCVGVTASTTATIIMFMLIAVSMRMGVLLRSAVRLGFCRQK